MEIRRIHVRSKFLAGTSALTFITLAMTYLTLGAKTPYVKPEPVTIQSRGAIISGDGKILAHTVNRKYYQISKAQYQDSKKVWQQLPETTVKPNLNSKNYKVSEKIVPNRQYPYGNNISQLVGFVYPQLNATGRWGAAGMEMSLDAELQQHDLQLTLQAESTIAIEDVLRRHVRDQRAKSASLVAIESRTGRILALANYPTAPHRPAPYIDMQWVNFATSVAFEPGSVMKPMIMAAALDAGVIKNTSWYPTPKSRDIDGHTINDAAPRKEYNLDLKEILKYSSNVGMSLIAEEFPKVKMHNYMKNYGFGQKMDIAGIVAARGQLNDYSRWSDLDRASNAFGQGVSTTVLQLAAAANVIANDGMYVQPYIVENEHFAHEYRVVSQKSAKTVKNIMCTIAQEDNLKKYVYIKGYKLCGKTGTAQIARDGGKGYLANDYNTTFVGFFNTQNSKITMAVRVERPKKHTQGLDVAAPLFRDAAKILLAETNTVPQN